MSARESDSFTCTQRQPIELLERLLERGDSVYVERGRLTVESASGKSVPPDWLKKHRHELAQQVLKLLRLNAYCYKSHSLGRYGGRKIAGLTMQFESFMGATEAYSIFNVELSRARSTQGGAEGSPLPSGKFRPLPDSSLSKLWKYTGLPLRCPAAMPDYMGNLRGILFFGTLTPGRTDGRLEASMLRPLTITTQEVRQALLSDKSQRNAEQNSDKARTNMPYSDWATAQQMQAFQAVPSTCEERYGKEVIRECDSRVAPFPAVKQKSPQEQTTDEWLDAYSSPRLLQ